MMKSAGYTKGFAFVDTRFKIQDEGSFCHASCIVDHASQVYHTWPNGIDPDSNQQSITSGIL
jgi:hypothetical protein